MEYKKYFFLNFIFFNCSSLVYLPDISKWNIFNNNIIYLDNYLSLIEKQNLDLEETYKFNSFINKKINDLYLGEYSLEFN